MMKKLNEENKRNNENIVILVLLCSFLLFFGVPRTIRLNHLFETDSVLVSATIEPYRTKTSFGTYGTSPAFKGTFSYEGKKYTAFIERDIKESEYTSLHNSDTVVLRILKSKPTRARWEKSYGIRRNTSVFDDSIR